MSYFLLPKNNNNIQLDISFSYEPTAALSSITINTLHYYSVLQQSIQHIINSESLLELLGTIDHDIMNVYYPYEYIYKAFPGSHLPISKLKSKTILLYDLIEINNLLDLFGSFKNQKLNILNIGIHFEDFKCYSEILGETNEHEIISFSPLDLDKTNEITGKKFNFIFVEDEATNKSKVEFHFQNIIKIIFTILKTLDVGGHCLIKINNVFYKPLIEMLYLFSSLFEKVYIIKPSSSNAATFEKYIFCKCFSAHSLHTDIPIDNNNNNNNNNNEDISLYSIINKEIPCYFLNKIQDSNSVLVQQQLDAMEQIINIFKTKNLEDKLELLKKTNIQKSCAWCEKYKVPYNKLNEKINIFLPLSKESTSYELKEEETHEI